MRGLYYTLDENKNPVPTSDVMEWSRAITSETKRVGFYEEGNTQVSTVFLGLDHNYADGPPILFETMVFSNNPDINEFQDRYCTWDEAVKGHQSVVQAVKDGVNINGRKTLKLKLPI